MALTGIRVPRSKGEPLSTPGLTSTSGHSDQSTVSMLTIKPPRTLFLLRTCIVARARTCFKQAPWETAVRGRRRPAPASADRSCMNVGQLVNSPDVDLLLALAGLGDVV